MRQVAREIAFKMIYQTLFNNEPELSFNLASEGLNLSEEDKNFYDTLFDSFSENFQSINDVVSELSEGYEIDRIYRVDLALLYLAVAEINYVKTAPAIVINEVVNLSKKYSAEKSQKFINGVLAKLVK